ncbi:MAG: DUF1761 domain-containing protein [Hyphomicrobiaceae bacterium]|nr:DUF1761 domain-containing protein [Hyphomicrobiaceae bacterium]
MTWSYYPAILIAAIASFAFGAAWYTALRRQWLSARGLTEAEAQARTGTSRVPFIISFLALLIMAWAVSGILLHLARGGTVISVPSGLITGFLLWLGFVITTMAVNHAFRGERHSLTLIDGGHWLGVLLIQGAILGWWTGQ